MRDVSYPVVRAYLAGRRPQIRAEAGRGPVEVFVRQSHRPKTETDLVVSLTAEQVTLYEAVVRETMEAIAARQGIERAGLVFKLLTSLKQICNHPAHYLKQNGTSLAGRSGKLPAVEDQATDRAYRIGEDSPVQVHRLIAEGTLEDRIAALLEKKRELAEAVLGAGEGWLTDLSDSELSELVSLRAAP